MVLDEIVLAENLVEHHLHIVAGVPVVVSLVIIAS